MNDKSNDENVSVEITPEKEINSELAKINLGIEAIELLKERFGSLELTDLDDKVTLKRIHDAHMEVVRARTGIEKYCKAKRDYHTDYNKSNRAIELNLIKLLTPLEEKLKAEKEKPEKEKERLQIEQAEKDAARNQERIDLLINNGMTFNGFAFTFEGDSILLAEIKALPEETFTEYLSGIKKRNDAALILQAEAHTKAKADAETLAKQKAEQDAIAEQQRQQQQKLDDEKKLLAEQKLIARENILQSIGMSENAFGKYEYKLINISTLEIEGMTDEEFHKEVQQLKGRIAALKVSEKAAEEKRIADLAEQKIKDAELAKENEEKERLRILSLAPDKDKLIAFVNAFALIPLPDVQSVEANQILIEGASMVAKARDFILNKVNNLK